MADDEVGVEPDRLAELASALENLREVLARNVPVIVNTMEEYWNSGVGTPINLMPLKQAQAQSVQDAADMRARSNLAQAWMNQAVNIDMVSSGMAQIPWDTANIDTADAHLQAQQLAAAEKSGNRAQIQAIQTDIQDHVDDNDAGWLTAFYNQASPQVANLAATLNSEDGGNGVVLSEQDQHILNTFARGLAAADKTGKLSTTAVSAYANSKNLWSVGMLFKFGPPGSAYGTQESGTPPNVTPNLLARVTTAIEMARLKPGGYIIPLTGSNVAVGGEGADFTTQTLQQFDPAQSMLTLATQNGAAAREILAGPDGQTIAQALMTRPTSFYYSMFENGNSNSLQGFFVTTLPNQYFQGQLTDYAHSASSWQTHPITISSGVVGNFFNSATGAVRGSDNAAYDSAMAAMNLVDATPAPGTAELPAQVQQALLNTAQRYLVDLSMSANNPYGSKVMPFGNASKAGTDAPWSVLFQGQTPQGGNSNPVADFLQQIASNPGDAGVLEASVKTALGKYYALQATGKGFPAPLQDSQVDQDMATMYGRFLTEVNNYDYQGAQLTDERNAEYNALLAFGESQATKIPVIGSTLGTAQTTAGLLGINLPQFSTDNAATTAQTDAQNFAIAGTQLNVPMVQALINEGAIPASSLHGQSWYQNGTVVVNSNTGPAFEAWFYAHGGDFNLQKDQLGYENLMGIQQNTSSESGG